MGTQSIEILGGILKIQKMLAAGIMAAVVIVGAQIAPANADTNVTGDPAVETALAATKALANQSALEVINGNGYLTSYLMFHQPTGDIPANVVFSMGLPQNVYAVGLGQDQGSLNQGYNQNNLSIDQVLYQTEQLLEPEVWGFTIGGLAPETMLMAGASTLTDYSLTKQDDTHYLVHYAAENTADPVNNPMYATEDLVVTLANGYVNDIQVNTKFWTLQDQSDLESTDSSVQFVTDKTQLDADWSAAWTSWNAMHFDPSVQTMAAEVTHAFKVSNTFAMLKGLTVTDPTPGAKSIATYSKKAGTTVTAALNDKNRVIGVQYTSSLRQFDELWVRIFGMTGFGPKSITYNTKKRTYSLKGYTGDKVQVRVDKAGHVVGVVVKSDPNSEFATTDYNSTFSYTTNKAVAKKWLAVDSDTRVLVAELSEISSGGDERGKGKATFRLNSDGTVLEATFTASADASLSLSTTILISAFPPGTLKKALKLLGLKLS